MIAGERGWSAAARSSRAPIFKRARSFLVLAQARQERVVLDRARVLHGLDPGRDVAQEPAHDLAAARFGQRVGEADLARPRELADLLRDVLHQLALERLVGDDAADRRD